MTIKEKVLKELKKIEVMSMSTQLQRVENLKPEIRKKENLGEKGLVVKTIKKVPTREEAIDLTLSEVEKVIDKTFKEEFGENNAEAYLQKRLKQKVRGEI